MSNQHLTSVRPHRCVFLCSICGKTIAPRVYLTSQSYLQSNYSHCFYSLFAPSVMLIFCFMHALILWFPLSSLGTFGVDPNGDWWNCVFFFFCFFFPLNITTDFAVNPVIPSLAKVCFRCCQGGFSPLWPSRITRYIWHMYRLLC